MIMNKKAWGLFVCAMVCLLGPPLANASIMTYSSASSFDSALTGLTTTNYAPTGSEPAGYYSSSTLMGAAGYSYNSTVNFNGGNFSGSTNWQLSNNTYFWGVATATSFPGNFLYNRQGGTALAINFTSPVYGFAIDFGIQYDWNTPIGIPGLTVTMNGTPISVTTPGYMATWNSGWVSTGVPVSYEGFASSTPFTTVAIYDSSKGFSVSDITIASGVAGGTLSGGTLVQVQTSQVPEPGSIALLMFGGLGFIGAGRKFKNNGNHNSRFAA
jgi:hypothetical protein